MSPTFKNIAAVTFDVGGTLIQPWPSVGQIYADVAACHGYKVSPEAVEAAFGRAWRSKQGFDYSQHAWLELVRRTFRGLVEMELEGTLFDDLYKRFRSADVWRVFDDVRPTLTALQARGLRLGIISNWDERLRPLLDDLNLSRFFTTVAISCEVGAAKPALAIFEHACDSLGVRAEKIVHIGDGPEEDVSGATAAGFQAVRLARDPESTTARGDARLATLAELPGLLQPAD